MDCGCAQVQLGRDFKRFLKNVMILKVISVDLTLARARSIGPSPYSNDKILR